MHCGGVLDLLPTSVHSNKSVHYALSSQQCIGCYQVQRVLIILSAPLHNSLLLCVRVQFTPSCTNLCISNCTKTRSLLTCAVHCAICLMSTLCFIGDLCTAHCAVLSGKSVFIARPRLPKSSLHRYAAQKFAHDQVHAELRPSQGKVWWLGFLKEKSAFTLFWSLSRIYGGGGDKILQLRSFKRMSFHCIALFHVPGHAQVDLNLILRHCIDTCTHVYNYTCISMWLCTCKVNMFVCIPVLLRAFDTSKRARGVMWKRMLLCIQDIWSPDRPDRQ